MIVGGMRSVCWTDVIQGLLLLSAMLLSAVAVMYALQGPAAEGLRGTVTVEGRIAESQCGCGVGLEVVRVLGGGR